MNHGYLCFDIFDFIKNAQLKSIRLSSVCSSIHKVTKSQDYGQNKWQILAGIMKELSINEKSIAYYTLVTKILRLLWP